MKGSIDDALNITRILDVVGGGETGAGCRIVIIDTGIIPGERVAGTYNLTNESMADTIGHGAIIQYIIRTILPDAEIYAIKVPDPLQDNILITALNHALRWRPHAINLSFSSEIPTDGTDPCSLYVDYVSQKGVAVCISAGNSGPRMLSIGSPAVAKEGITVGATDVKGRPWVKSSRGPTLDGRWKPNIVAPTNFVIPELSERAAFPGTSFSTPLVTAVAAVLVRELGDSYVARRLIEIAAASVPLVFSGNITIKGVRRKSVIRRLVSAWGRLIDPRNIVGMGLLNAAESLQIAQTLRDKITRK